MSRILIILLTSRFHAEGVGGVLIMEKGALSWKDRSC